MKNEKRKMLADQEGISHFIVEGDAPWVRAFPMAYPKFWPNFSLKSYFFYFA
jgi:hypothetical protein